MVRVDIKTNRITEKFAQLQANNQKALITFLTAGDPDLTKTAELVLTMEKNGSDIIELGIPYSDPLADGPVIQAASQRALKAGTTLNKIFEMVVGLRAKTQVPLVLMTYINPIIQFGIQKFAERASEAGIDGLIIPDLPLEEAGLLGDLTARTGIVVIPMLAPTSTDSRIAKIAQEARGFIYCVSLTGVTGVREQANQNIKPFIDKVRTFTDKPLAIGFGISNPEQAKKMSDFADGVIVGSALVKIIEENADSPNTTLKVGALVKSLKDAVI